MNSKKQVLKKNFIQSNMTRSVNTLKIENAHKEIKSPCRRQIFLFIFLFVIFGSTLYKLQAQQDPKIVIELGLTYDSSFMNRCGGTDSAALEQLLLLMIEVNDLFDKAPQLVDFDILVWPKQIRQVNGFNRNSNRTYNASIARYWTQSRTGNDLCYEPDMAHHISGVEANLGHAETGGPCNLYPKSETEGASHTTYTNISAIRQQAFAVVHELLHQIGLGHDNCSGVPFGSHCLMDGTTGGTTFNESDSYTSIWMSNDFVNILNARLNNNELNCIDSSEQQFNIEPDPDCQSCDNEVILTANNAEYLNYFVFDCLDTISEDTLTLPINTVFKNS